jgi:hypothetical protein
LATPVGARQVRSFDERGYASLGSQSECAVIRSYFFFHLFYEEGETSACNLSRARPRRSRFAPMTGSLARCHSKIRINANTRARPEFPGEGSAGDSKVPRREVL